MLLLFWSKVVSYNTVIKSIISVCHRDTSVFFNLSSNYSNVSFYFAWHLGMPPELLDIPIYISTQLEILLFPYRVYMSYVKLLLATTHWLICFCCIWWTLSLFLAWIGYFRIILFWNVMPPLLQLCRGC